MKGTFLERFKNKINEITKNGYIDIIHNNKNPIVDNCSNYTMTYSKNSVSLPTIKNELNSKKIVMKNQNKIVPIENSSSNFVKVSNKKPLSIPHTSYPNYHNFIDKGIYYNKADKLVNINAKSPRKLIKYNIFTDAILNKQFNNVSVDTSKQNITSSSTNNLALTNKIIINNQIKEINNIENMESLREQYRIKSKEILKSIKNNPYLNY